MPNAPRRYQPHKQPQRKPWQQTRGTNKERGYSTDWNKLRNAYIAEHPLCERCEAQGHITEAKEVHHKVAFNGVDDPLRLDPTNLESVCWDCHRARERERKKGHKPVITMNHGILHIVCGPPGSGKTTYVNNRRQPTDLVFDFDSIAYAMGATLYECPSDWVSTIENVRETILHHPGNRWVIYTDIGKAREAASRHRGRLTILDTPLETCIERLRQDNRPRLNERIERAKAWWHEKQSG